MATLAEQLRNEINIHSVMPWLKEETIKHIRWNGVYSMICDKHIDKISESWAIPNKYYDPIKTWAESEGFKVYSTYNSYGVRSINIEL